MSLLTTIANATSVALEKARLFTETVRLLQVTKERNAELAFVNGVQEVLVSNVEMQAIYDTIGGKIHQIFNAQVVDIGLLDPTIISSIFPTPSSAACAFRVKRTPFGDFASM